MYGEFLFHAEHAVAVDGEEKLIVKGDSRLDVKEGIARKDDGAVAERMGTDRREDNALDARIDDRAARRKRVGGGAGGGGDNNAVGAVIETRVAVVHNAEVDDVGHRPARQHHVVERDIAVLGLSLVPDGNVEHHAALDLVFLGEEAGDELQLAHFQTRHKAQTSLIESQDGLVVDGGDGRRTQDRAVPAERDDRVAVFGQLIDIFPRKVAAIPVFFLVVGGHENRRAVPVQGVAKLGRAFKNARLVVVWRYQ